MKKENKLTYIVFGLYFIFLVWLIIFKFSFSLSELPHIRNINLIPFGDSMITNNKLDLSEIIYNILVFVPLGVYLSILKKDYSFWKKVLIIFFLSLSFEIIQYVFAIGGSDITDLIGNTFGGIIGIYLYRLLNKLFKNKTVKIINILGLILEICFICLFILLMMG